MFSELRSGLLDMRAETHVALHVKYPLLLSHFKQNSHVNKFYKNSPI
jgi:hypothetical protein